ncbi:hypothetical protein E3T28_05730 [Cryobacterium sinapicolor]|uniref:Uncharacterized protein n=1 Tax=Cryobacterium sinapicolor TaxID=1259236 RepID=A0ABY2JES6_9MICO|nr:MULTISPECIES: hypothetical protein [Cryobacterium]TFC82725.1 hypothetical protein E3O67_16310 [Cryobacterium sp. TMT3-29-2]TFD02316.1 hypothetical protein E3T28_05730 [Cryobacterium sinapicolor]
MTSVFGTSTAYDRGTVVIGAAAIVLAGFVFGTSLPTEFRFVNIGLVGASILVAAGILAIVSGIIRSRLLRLIAGTLLTGAALLQLVGLALSVRPLGGDASAMAVAGGLGMALLALSLSPAPPAQPHDPTKGRP